MSDKSHEVGIHGDQDPTPGFLGDTRDDPGLTVESGSGDRLMAGVRLNGPVLLEEILRA